MKILVTNDDGYSAEGIKILVEKAKKYGEVYVVAPKTEQSAMSHAIKVKEGFQVKRINDFNEVEAYYVDSTPADCIRFAYYGLKLDFDVIFSGINKGFNIGEDIMYSGTVSAVFEAASISKKAIAFSTDKESFDGAIDYFDDVIKYIMENKLLEISDLYNVNFPRKSDGILITKQGGCNFNTYFKKQNDMMYQLGDAIFEKDTNKMYLDTACVMNNYISITPLTYNRTDMQVYELLKNKNLK